jgi:hypothetical protein
VFDLSDLYQHLGENDDKIGVAGVDFHELDDYELRKVAERELRDIDELEFNSISAPMATKPCAAPASPVLHKVRIH